MSRQTTILIKSTLILMLGMLMACGEKAPPATQPRIVSQKIAAQPANTTAKTVAPAVKPQKAEPNKEISAPGVPAKDASAQSDLVKESMQIAGSYDPKGRFDPFEPLFQEQPTAPVAPTTKDKRKKRIPQTPLERVALGQLKLSAIIRAPSGNRALVEDATGKGYVVIKGTYIGLNSGTVARIENDRIVIEEEIQNVLGEYKIQNTEIKLQKPAGEL